MVRSVFRLLVALVVLTAYSASARTHTQNQSATSGAGGRNGYTLVLIDADSKAALAEARDFILSQGGRVAVVVPPHAIMGWISPETDSKILGHNGIRSIYRPPLGSALENR